MGWPITHPSTIYAIRCKENGKLYIGRTYDLIRRTHEHFSELRRNAKKKTMYPGKRTLSNFQLDYNQYGEEAFEVYILEENVPPEKCKSREAFWISQYDTTNPKRGYNKFTEAEKPVKLKIQKGLTPCC